MGLLSDLKDGFNDMVDPSGHWSGHQGRRQAAASGMPPGYAGAGAGMGGFPPSGVFPGSQRPAPIAKVSVKKSKNDGKVGVGMSILKQTDGGFEITEVAPGKGADVSGQVFVGDVIKSIDGKSILSYSESQLVPLLLGDLGTVVTLGLSRNGQSAEAKVVRCKQTKTDQKKSQPAAAPVPAPAQSQVEPETNNCPYPVGDNMDAMYAMTTTPPLAQPAQGGDGGGEPPAYGMNMVSVTGGNDGSAPVPYPVTPPVANDCPAPAYGLNVASGGGGGGDTPVGYPIGSPVVTALPPYSMDPSIPVQTAVPANMPGVWPAAAQGHIPMGEPVGAPLAAPPIDDSDAQPWQPRMYDGLVSVNPHQSIPKGSMPPQ